MRLAKLIRILEYKGILREVRYVDGIDSVAGQPVTDNRMVQPGDIFACIKGLSVDGHKFAAAAIEKGAALIICEDPVEDGLPQVRVTDSRKAAALAAKLYHNDPSTKFRLIGVTGTNGKTSTSLIIFRALRAMGYKAGWIGTMGYYINDQEHSTNHTTPDIMELNGILATMVQADVSHVVMEVSSHALALDRVFGLEYDLCLFTNLSREHLDFHRNMEEYGAAKLKLFENVTTGKSVGLINIDDTFGNHIFHKLSKDGGFVFSIGREKAGYQISEIVCTWDNSKFALTCPEGTMQVTSQLLGQFNVSNLAMACAALNLLGFEAREIVNSISSIAPVPGRFQPVPNAKGKGVFVDYSHTPDALENIIKACRELPHRRIICLIGAGGDRDQGKRPLMLSSALHNADVVIISDDNPRTENPNRIVLDMVSDTHLDLPWWIIRDRRLAIRSAINLARTGDIVLLCGKGHEEYQEIEGIKHHFSDVEEASLFLESADSHVDGLAIPIDDLMIRLLSGNSIEMPESGYMHPRTYGGISTDSRSIMPGSLYFALKGERYDGHAFLGNVLQDKTNSAIGEISLPEMDQYIQVHSSIDVMAALHRKYLLMFDVFKIALTGSTGKTSTKELLRAVFSEQAPTLCTDANENNLIGLCKTIRRIRPEHEYAIFEIGTNHFGEIKKLADTCSPDAGIIINIGPSHLESFGDENGVYIEKTDLFRRTLRHRLYDADDPKFEEFHAIGAGVGFHDTATYRISAITSSTNSLTFSVNDNVFEIPFTAPHMAVNAAYAVSMGMRVGIPVATISRALLKPMPVEMRMQVEELAHKTLIADCYNANPVSMQKAIEYWIGLHKECPHVAILGDMLELGAMANHYHAMIGAILAEHEYHTLITVGELSVHYHPQTSPVRVIHFPDIDTAMLNVADIDLPNNSVVLVKASHGIELHKLLPTLREG